MSQKVRVFGLKTLFLKRFTVRSTTCTLIIDKTDHALSLHSYGCIYFIAKAKRNWKAWISRPNHQVLDLKSVLNLEHSTHTGIHTKFGTCSLYTLVPRYGRTVVIRHNELYDFLFWGCWAIRSRSRIRNWPWCRIILQGGRFSTERWFFADVSTFDRSAQVLQNELQLYSSAVLTKFSTSVVLVHRY